VGQLDVGVDVLFRVAAPTDIAALRLGGPLAVEILREGGALEHDAIGAAAKLVLAADDLRRGEVLPVVFDRREGRFRRGGLPLGGGRWGETHEEDKGEDRADSRVHKLFHGDGGGFFSAGSRPGPLLNYTSVGCVWTHQMISWPGRQNKVPWMTVLPLS